MLIHIYLKLIGLTFRFSAKNATTYLLIKLNRTKRFKM